MTTDADQTPDKPKRRPRRIRPGLAARVSTRMSEAALLGLVLVAIAPLPGPRASQGFVQGSTHAVDPAKPAVVAVRTIDIPRRASQTAEMAAPRVAAAPAKPADTKPADAKPLPVPPAVAPSEPQPDQWSPSDIAEAKEVCAGILKSLTLTAEAAPPMRNGACGTPAPLSVRKIGDSGVELQPAALMTCKLAAALDRWIADTVQPAAKAELGSPVERLAVAASYTCRNRYGQAGAPISEHAFANALDISGFVLADGRTISVVDGWGATARETAATAKTAVPSAAMAKNKPGQAIAAPVVGPPAPATPSAAFLRRLHKGACGTFGTVLGPEANDAHRDHLHVDLKTRARAPVCD